MNDYTFRYGQHQKGHVYEWISLANHSCEPNASAVPGLPATLRALRDILEGEEVTIAYSKDKARFKCRCDACERRRGSLLRRKGSVDGSTAEYLRRQFGSIGKSRSSRETSTGDDEDEYYDDRASGDFSGGAMRWLKSTASSIRRVGAGKQDESPAQDESSERPAEADAGNG